MLKDKNRIWQAARRRSAQCEDNIDEFRPTVSTSRRRFPLSPGGLKGASQRRRLPLWMGREWRNFQRRESSAYPPRYERATSRRHQRPRALEIFRNDRVRRPIGERAHRTGRIVGGVLREQRRAHHEQIVG